MNIAEKLGKTLEEIIEISTLEFQMWVAYFEIKNELEEEARPKLKLISRHDNVISVDFKAMKEKLNGSA